MQKCVTQIIYLGPLPSRQWQPGRGQTSRVVLVFLSLQRDWGNFIQHSRDRPGYKKAREHREHRELRAK